MVGSNNEIMAHDVEFPSYTPPSSLGHELGVLFAFFTLCVITIPVYWIFWQASQRRAVTKEKARREALAERMKARDAVKRQNALSLNPKRASGGSSVDRSGVSPNSDATPRLPGERNGTSTAGFAFGDTEENMIV